jgi:uncharacterized protein YwqG
LNLKVAEGSQSAMHFLAQINLEEMPFLDDALPRKGWLYFFLHADSAFLENTGGYGPYDSGWSRVFYYDGERDTLKRTRRPGVNASEFHLCTLTPRVEASLPSREPLARGEAFSEQSSVFGDDRIKNSASYRKLRKKLSTSDQDARLLGWHDTALELDLEPRIEQVIHGKFSGGPAEPGRAPLSEQTLALCYRRAKDWRLLLQLPTDTSGQGPGFDWLSNGCLYFFIRRQDLRARRFDAHWALIQLRD